MKLIAQMCEYIEEEIGDATKYAEAAHRLHAEHPRLADKFIDLADAEMAHAKILHGETEKLIEEARQRDGEPPAGMLAVYEYEHAKQIKRAAAARQLIADYRNS